MNERVIQYHKARARKIARQSKQAPIDATIIVHSSSIDVQYVMNGKTVTRKFNSLFDTGRFHFVKIVYNADIVYHPTEHPAL